MKHEDQVKQLNTDVDRLLHQPDATIQRKDPEYDELLGVVQVLARADMAALSQKQEATKERLMRRQTDRRGIERRFQPTMVGIVAVLALMVAIFTIPPLRVMAEDVMQSIGHLIFTGGPTAAEEEFASEGKLLFDDVAPEEPLTLEEAQRQVGFPILAPTYLPESMALHTINIAAGEAGVTVTLGYGGPYFLTISQMEYDGPEPVTYPVGDDVAPQPVSVRGVEGAWLEGVPDSVGGLASEEDPDVIGARLLFYDNLLIWEENDVIYTIRTNSDQLPEGEGIEVTAGEPALSLSEVVQIAESLQPLE